MSNDLDTTLLSNMTEETYTKPILMTTKTSINSEDNGINIDYRDNIDNDDDDDDSIKKPESSIEQIKSVIAYKKYIPLLPMICFYIAAGYMPSVFMSAYGAEWFALKHCDTSSVSSMNNECKYDYTTWTLYNSLFLSLRGVIAFLFAGFIGRLSDAYGRKRFFYLHIITNALPIIPLIFVNNLWPYFIFYLFGGVNGSNNSATPIMVAYISDIIPSKHRTIGFALMYLMGGIGLFIGSISAIIISIIWDDYINFIVITMIYILLLIYTYFILSESLSIENYRPLIGSITSSFNPFKPLTHIFEHPIIYKCCIICFLISLPETGVIDTAIPYMLDQLEINDNKSQANIITGTFILICGFGMIICNIILLPYLKKKYNDYEICIIGAILVTLSMFMFATISWIPSIILVCITAFILSLSFIVFPSLYCIATKYLSSKEQGLGIGIIFACRGLTYSLAPFSFGYSYSAFKSIGFPSFPYIIATLICSTSIIVIIYGLKPAIDLVKLSPNAYCLSMEDLPEIEKQSLIKRRSTAVEIYKKKKKKKHSKRNKIYHKVDINSSSDDDNANL